LIYSKNTIRDELKDELKDRLKKPFGKNGEYIWIFLNEVEQGLHAIEYAFDRCEKIRVKKIISSEVIELIDSYFGYELPRNETGLYEYDWKKLEWVKVDE
jgi:hypothetical protein